MLRIATATVDASLRWVNTENLAVLTSRHSLPGWLNQGRELPPLPTQRLSPLRSNEAIRSDTHVGIVPVALQRVDGHSQWRWHSAPRVSSGQPGQLCDGIPIHPPGPDRQRSLTRCLNSHLVDQTQPAHQKDVEPLFRLLSLKLLYDVRKSTPCEIEAGVVIKGLRITGVDTHENALPDGEILSAGAVWRVLTPSEMWGHDK